MFLTSIKSVFIFAFASLVFWTSGAKADEVTANELVIVTHRHTEWTELYVSADASTMFDVFSVSHTELTGATDRVDFGALRTGTAWLGERLLHDTQMTVGDSDSEFVAMSFMVHPNDIKLPMTTPLEGMTAIGVCAGPEVGTFVSIFDLYSYVGYFADAGSLDAPIQIAFSNVDRALTVRVFDHDQTGEITSYTKTVESGEELVLAPEARRGSGFLSVLAGVLPW